MINKPQDWEDVQESEVVAGLKLVKGAYPIQIKNIINHPEKEYFEIQFDIVKDKTYAGWFSKLDEQFGVWPSQGKTYKSYKQTATKFLKAFITAIQKSNNGYVWNWDEQTLKGKYCVAVFGEEEYEAADGTIKTSVKCQDIRSLEAWQKGEIKIPELKKLTVKVKKDENPFNPTNFSMSDEDLPF